MVVVGGYKKMKTKCGADSAREGEQSPSSGVGGEERGIGQREVLKQ